VREPPLGSPSPHARHANVATAKHQGSRPLPTPQQDPHPGIPWSGLSEVGRVATTHRSSVQACREGIRGCRSSHAVGVGSLRTRGTFTLHPVVLLGELALARSWALWLFSSVSTPTLWSRIRGCERLRDDFGNQVGLQEGKEVISAHDPEIAELGM
jgi:hypothetical protein